MTVGMIQEGLSLNASKTLSTLGIVRLERYYRTFSYLESRPRPLDIRETARSN